MTRRRAGPSDAVSRERARHGGMDATTAPHHIPPEMPQYGETYHVFELMQVTEAAPSRRGTGRGPGASVARAGCAAATPQRRGVHSCAAGPRGMTRSEDALAPNLRTQDGGKGRATRPGLGPGCGPAAPWP